VCVCVCERETKEHSSIHHFLMDNFPPSSRHALGVSVMTSGLLLLFWRAVGCDSRTGSCQHASHCSSSSRLRSSASITNSSDDKLLTLCPTQRLKHTNAMYPPSADLCAASERIAASRTGATGTGESSGNAVPRGTQRTDGTPLQMGASCASQEMTLSSPRHHISF